MEQEIQLETYAWERLSSEPIGEFNSIAVAPIRASIYCRDIGGRNDQDPATKLQLLREFCESEGWIVFEEYQDDGPASCSMAFECIIGEAVERRFDVLVFWAVEEFPSCESQGHVDWLDWFAEYGIAWHSMTDPCVDSRRVMALLPPLVLTGGCR